MNRLITIEPYMKTRRIVNKSENRTCEVEIKHEGIFEGFIEKIHSSGRYEVRLIKQIEGR